MRDLCLLILIVIALAARGSAQKRVANDVEYQLIRRASQETEATRQVEVLLEWEAAFPASELQRDRIEMLITAYSRTGQPVNAFRRAAQLYKLDTRDIKALYLVATLALSLPAPSPDEIIITKDAATNLLARATEVGRMARAAERTGESHDPEQASDPEIQRTTALIRDWRRSKSVPAAADVENEIRAVAERALSWAEIVSK